MCDEYSVGNRIAKVALPENERENQFLVWGRQPIFQTKKTGNMSFSKRFFRIALAKCEVLSANLHLWEPCFRSLKGRLPTLVLSAAADGEQRQKRVDRGGAESDLLDQKNCTRSWPPSTFVRAHHFRLSSPSQSCKLLKLLS